MNARKVIIGCLSGIVLFGIGPAGGCPILERSGRMGDGAPRSQSESVNRS